MADTSLQLLEAMEAFDMVAIALTPEAARQKLDESSLQIFWRDWPQISSWAGSLWRQLDGELAEAGRRAGPGVFEGGGD